MIPAVICEAPASTLAPHPQPYPVERARWHTWTDAKGKHHWIWGRKYSDGLIHELQEPVPHYYPLG